MESGRNGHSWISVGRLLVGGSFGPHQSRRVDSLFIFLTKVTLFFTNWEGNGCSAHLRSRNTNSFTWTAR